MSRFKGKGFKRVEEQQELEYIVPDFLIKNLINIVFAPPKQGKSMFMCGLSKWIYKNTKMRIEYYDNDNPAIALVDRGIDTLCEEQKDRFDYILGDELESLMRDEDTAISDMKDVLELLVKDVDSINKNYQDILFIFDSATDFCNEMDDNSVKGFMGKMKKLRRAGATIVILHHTNKRDPNFKGSGVFRSSSDVLYKLTLEYENSDGMVYKLEKENDKARFRIKNCAFILKDNFELEMLDYDEVCISQADQIDIRKIVVTLRQNKGSMQQGELLSAALDTTSANKTAISFLERYNNKYWTFTKEGRNNIYTLI